jgi:hypothetical protein
MRRELLPKHLRLSERENKLDAYRESRLWKYRDLNLFNREASVFESRDSETLCSPHLRTQSEVK